jgi:hypothetical protein
MEHSIKAHSPQAARFFLTKTMIKAITRPAGITTQTGTVTVCGELVTVTTYSGISLSLFALPEDGKLMQIKRLSLPAKSFYSS